MSATQTGGPAFPTPETITGCGRVEPFSSGMTLRDYFAAAALPAVKTPGPATGSEIANLAYAVADAMLKARSAV